MSQRLPLDGIRILCFVGDDYEDLELWYPKFRIEEAGGHVTLAGLERGIHYRGKHGYPCRADAAIAEMEVEDFHGVVCPGGWMPDKLRRDPNVFELLRGFHDKHKLIAAICHGPQLLIEAGVVKGRKLTSWPSVRTDLENAGAKWVDREVVTDQNLITSRKPADLDAFTDEILAHLRSGEQKVRAAR